MCGRKTKTEVPSSEKINLDGAEIWMISWNSYHHQYSYASPKPTTKAFLTKDDAERFKQYLIDVNTVLQNDTRLNITIEREQLGLTLEEARKVYTDGPIRVMMKDGEHLMGTRDYNPYRLNVSTVHDKITKILSVG